MNLTQTFYSLYIFLKFPRHRVIGNMTNVCVLSFMIFTSLEESIQFDILTKIIIIIFSGFFIDIVILIVIPMFLSSHLQKNYVLIYSSILKINETSSAILSILLLVIHCREKCMIQYIKLLRLLLEKDK